MFLLWTWTQSPLSMTQGKPMKAIKRARHFIERNPHEPAAAVLSQLVLALESKRSFELAALYELDLDTFDLAVEILKEWRLDRYYAGKAKLFDLSLQMSDLDTTALSGQPN